MLRNGRTNNWAVEGAAVAVRTGLATSSSGVKRSVCMLSDLRYAAHSASTWGTAYLHRIQGDNKRPTLCMLSDLRYAAHSASTWGTAVAEVHPGEATPPGAPQ
eukprot:4249359-Pyramimonas_sp.AAC.1